MEGTAAGSTRSFVGVDSCVLGVSNGEPFNARAFLRMQRDTLITTEAFWRSVGRRFTRFDRPDPVHVTGHELTRIGVALKDIPQRLGSHRLVHASQIIEVISREETDPNDVFSNTYENFIHVGPVTWMHMKRGKGRTWILDARTIHDRHLILPRYTRVIVRS